MNTFVTHPKYKCYQQGIALIQVLLITAILSVLALFISQTAKEQVKQAQWSNDKIQAQIAIHSAESLLLFELLTNKKNTPIESNRVGSVNEINQLNVNYPYISNWNFYSLPFKINKSVTAKIQDQSSLIQLHYPKGNTLIKLLISKGIAPSKAEAVVDNLLDWQDIDNIQRQNGAEADNYGGSAFIRDGPMPVLNEIKKIKILSPSIQQIIIENTTIYHRGTFSPLNSPIDILQTLTDKSSAEQVVLLRKLGMFSSEQFKQITGIEETDDMYFYNSNYLKIDLSSQVGESRANKSMFIHIQPYVEAGNNPINTFVSRG